jgi:hypothetical protein
VAVLGLVGAVFAAAQLFNPALRRVEDAGPPPGAAPARPAAGNAGG